MLFDGIVWNENTTEADDYMVREDNIKSTSIQIRIRSFDLCQSCNELSKLIPAEQARYNARMEFPFIAIQQRHMRMDVPFVTNLQAIQDRRWQLIDTNLQRYQSAKNKQKTNRKIVPYRGNDNNKYGWWIRIVMIRRDYMKYYMNHDFRVMAWHILSENWIG